MQWLAPDSAPTDERAFLIQLDDSPDVVEPVSIARFSRRDGVYLDVLNRIILTPKDSRFTGWQPLPKRGAAIAGQLAYLSRRGQFAALASLLAAGLVGGASYFRNGSVIDAIFTTAAVFAVLILSGLVFQRIRHGRIPPGVI